MCYFDVILLNDVISSNVPKISDADTYVLASCIRIVAHTITLSFSSLKISYKSKPIVSSKWLSNLVFALEHWPRKLKSETGFPKNVWTIPDEFGQIPISGYRSRLKFSLNKSMQNCDTRAESILIPGA